MKTLKHYLAAAAVSCIFCVTTVNAGTLTWDFAVEIDNLYRDDANVIDDSIVAGSALYGSFSYDDGLTDNSPTNNYVDTYTAPSGTFTIAGLGIYDWDVEVSVVHQSSRDIVDVSGEYWSGNVKKEGRRLSTGSFAALAVSS